MKSRLSLLCSLALALTFNPNVHAEALKNSNPTVGQPQQDTSSAIVVLKGDPISTYAKTKPAQGKKIDFNSASVKTYRAQLNTLRSQFKKWLASADPKATINGKFDISINAVSVTLNGTTLDSIRSCPLVKDAQYEAYYYPTVDNPDLGLIHAIEAWQAGGGPANAGAEVKVAIIDSGIDIRHPCFSDAGTPRSHSLAITGSPTTKSSPRKSLATGPSASATPPKPSTTTGRMLRASSVAISTHRPASLASPYPSAFPESPRACCWEITTSFQRNRPAPATKTF